MQFLHDVSSMHGRYKEVIISKKRLSDVSVFIGGYQLGGMGFAILLPLLPPKLPPPFQISKIKESNKTKQKIEDNPLEKEEERKSCMFI